MSEYLFSYGTLQDEETQLNLFGRTLKGSSDILEDYKITTIEIVDNFFLAKGEDKFQKTLIPTGICGDFVEGTVFELSEQELSLLDEYEPKNYKRMRIILKSGKKAWIYLAM